ncbi:NXPE family member 3-like [Myripristis murdjan]|uniref:NXPE family member 3-like n=1 Tax=Myripristis murdjan TaxID=586833 RepID=UPI00117610C8|nr:NXPE family member 3-like [Myripristis murdjan]
METGAGKWRKFSTCRPTYAAIFLFLVVFAVYFLQRNIGALMSQQHALSTASLNLQTAVFLSLPAIPRAETASSSAKQRKKATGAAKSQETPSNSSWTSTGNPPAGGAAGSQNKITPTTPVPNRQHINCSHHQLSPEERHLLNSIAWPETPHVPVPVSLNTTSDPAHSTFTILPVRAGGQWHVGDELEALIQIGDFQGHPKQYGGDLVIARLHDPTLSAGVAGRVVDHLNGSYTAVFPLLWEGRAQVEVTLVHSSEAITVLHRVDREHPARQFFLSLFQSGSVSETVVCNFCLPPTQPLCNYTDLHTGEPWFCYKPKKLSCDTRINHYKGGCNYNLKAKEVTLFQSGVNMKVIIQASGPSNVTVLPKKKGQPEVKSSTVKPEPAGYYYQGAWQALGGTTVRQFSDSSAISQCLTGKVVNLYGDSTMRQWFEYLNSVLPDLKEFNLRSDRRTGPFMAVDMARSILVKYRFHSPPIVTWSKFPTNELRYVANELDGMVGGPNTVVVFSIWAHFGTFPVEVYMRRLLSIRRAVLRLLDRAPETLVVIRTGNLRTMTFMFAMTNSDWYSLQRDKVLRAVFKGLNVRLVDAWDMVLAHHLPHEIHPRPPIIKNMIDVLLSYICPKNKA